MQKFQISKGLVIFTDNEQYEYTDRAASELYFQSLESGKRKIIQEPDFWPGVQRESIAVLHSIVTDKIVETKFSDQTKSKFISELKPKYFTDLQRRLHYVAGLVKEGISRGCRKTIDRVIPKLAASLNDSTPPSASTVQTWMRQYQTSDDPNVFLINGNSFRAKSERVDTESELFLQNQIQLHYASITRPSITTAYKAYRNDLKQENLRRERDEASLLHPVSEKTFYNRIKDLPQKELLIAREGYEVARKVLKVSKGSLPADYPLDVVEIDHTLMNLYVVDDRSFLPLGRPWITAIKDRYSNILLGFYISFHAGGLKSIFGAIKHSLNSHQRAYEMWPDIENPWPAFGLGVVYCSDRGSDFMSQQYLSAILDLGASYEYCERRTPWLKGSIERFFGTLESTFFETMPGKTFNSLANRKDYNPREHAVIRFSTLTYLIHKWAADYHNVTPHSRKMASPLELWNEGVEIAPPRYPAFSQALDVILGLRNTGTLQNEGIQFLGLHYADPGLQDLVDDIGKKREVEFIVSPENLGYIHVKDPRSGEYMRVNCTRPDYAYGLTLFQHKYLRHEAKLHSLSIRSVDDLMSFRNVLALQVNEEISRKNNHVKKRLALVADINSNAILEGKTRSTSDIFGNLKEHQIPPKIITPPALPKFEPDNEEVSRDVVPFTNVIGYQWGY
jgi:putative transposase